MRLIDADALKQNMLITTAGTGYQSMVLAEIDDAPTVDAERHGKNISETGVLCSECSFGDFGGFHGYEPNYCPNCGAIMDK